MAAPDRPSAVQLADRVVAVCGKFRFTTGREQLLHDGVEEALMWGGIPTEREVRLTSMPGSRDRLDLLTAGGVAVEIKHGASTSTADLLVQLQRYARHDEVRALVVVTTRAAHCTLPAMIGGKPFRSHWVRSTG